MIDLLFKNVKRIWFTIGCNDFEEYSAINYFMYLLWAKKSIYIGATMGTDHLSVAVSGSFFSFFF